jgi:hypothetical protein
MLRFRATFILALLLLSFGGGAQAQSTPEELAEANRAAMDSYNNLDIEGAKRQLEEAARNAERNGIRGPALARTYANLGVVCVGGLSDNAAGLDAFVRALQNDPGVSPDPLVSTPDIQQVFMLAQRRAAGAGAQAPAPIPTAPGPTAPMPAARPTTTQVEGNLTHYPAMEQLTQTGVPVYVEVGELPVARAQVLYRSLGMAKPKTADMELTDDGGYGIVIPCADVFEPKVEYFIVAFDEEGQQIGNAGTPQNPVSVPIVAQRTAPAPALPGQAPPAQCKGGDECPPGMPGCSSGGAGNGGLGDTCSSNRDCGTGLVCDDDFCAVGERDDDEFGSKKKKKGKQAPFFFDIGFGLSGAFVGEDMKTDRPPPPELTSTLKEKTRPEVEEILKDAGWNCDIGETDSDGDGNPGGPGDQFTVSECKVAVKETGFVVNKPLTLTAGYFFLPQAYVAVTGRFMLLDDKGKGSLSGLAFGARVGYQFSQPKSTGFLSSIFAGGGAGQIQVRPGSVGPFADSGLGMAQVGMTFGYRFIHNLGLVLSPTLNVMVPTRMFVLDGTLAAEVAF